MVAKHSFQGAKGTVPGSHHIAPKGMGRVANCWLLVFSNYFMDRTHAHKMWFLENCLAHTRAQLLLIVSGQEAGTSLHMIFKDSKALGRQSGCSLPVVWL